MNIAFQTFTALRSSPRATAAFVLTILREDVGAYPASVTPKHPLPAIMQTERLLQELDNALAEGALSFADVGTDHEELRRLLDRARVLRLRYLLRAVRRGDPNAQAEAYDQAMSLIAAHSELCTHVADAALGEFADVCGQSVT